MSAKPRKHGSTDPKGGFDASTPVIDQLAAREKSPMTERKPGPIESSVTGCLSVLFWCAAMLAVAGVVLLVWVAVLKWAWRTVFH